MLDAHHQHVLHWFVLAHDPQGSPPDEPVNIVRRQLRTEDKHSSMGAPFLDGLVSPDDIRIRQRVIQQDHVGIVSRRRAAERGHIRIPAQKGEVREVGQRLPDAQTDNVLVIHDGYLDGQLTLPFSERPPPVEGSKSAMVAGGLNDDGSTPRRSVYATLIHSLYYKKSL